MRLFFFHMLFWPLLLLAPLLLEAQQILLVENVRNLNNYKYHPGDVIRLKVRSEPRIIEGPITYMNDSILSVGDWDTVAYGDIEVIYRERSVIRIFRGVLLLAGVGYLSLDVFNRLINSDSPVILAETTLISTGLVGLNFLLLPLKYKRIHTGKWRLLYLDFNELEMPPVSIPGRAPE